MDIFRYRVMGFIETPSTSGNVELVSYAPAIAFCNEISEASNHIKTMLSEFPVCTHFTVTRGAWK